MASPIALIHACCGDKSDATIVFAGERIVSVGVAPPPNATIIDLAGRRVLPAFVDAHVHLDKTLLGRSWHPHAATESVAGRIEAEKALRRREAPPIAECGGNLLATAVRNGTLAVRSHVDVDDQTGLANVEASLRLREEWQRDVTIQLVAFPQSGILRCRPAGDLLAEAVRMGCDLVGGLDPIGIDGDLDRHLDAVFGIAERFGVGIDLHLHDQGETGLSALLAICERSKALGMHGKVTISHAFCLGSVGVDRADAAAERLAEAGVSIITSAPGAAAMPPVKRLRRAGVDVAAGSDNIRDAWSPFGNASMIERCWMVALRSGFRTDGDLAATLDLATTGAAQVLALEHYGLEAGDFADLIAMPDHHPARIVVERTAPDFILRRGRILRDDCRLAVSPLADPDLK